MTPSCFFCRQTPLSSSGLRTIIRKGFFLRRCDGGRLTRYYCRSCKKNFSTATFDSCYRQKKRKFNSSILALLASGVSQRRTARILKLNKNTVEKKFVFLGQKAHGQLLSWNKSLPKASDIQFDDLETFEQSKHKPVSVTLAVENGTRRFLDFQVSQMPAKGKMAKFSVKKYGKRNDERTKGRAILFERLKDLVVPNAVVHSDENPHYTACVAKHFPQSTQIAHKGQRGSTTGQGELKQIRWDPLFSLNHTCAKMRADIARLIRKTWSTTKKKERLAYHIALFALYHNQHLKNQWV